MKLDADAARFAVLAVSASGAGRCCTHVSSRCSWPQNILSFRGMMRVLTPSTPVLRCDEGLHPDVACDFTIRSQLTAKDSHATPEPSVARFLLILSLHYTAVVR